MTKLTIDERISKLKLVIQTTEQRISTKVGEIKYLGEDIEKLRITQQARKEALSKLEAKKARQQKDQAIGNKLVESGVITEQENQKIQELPAPEHVPEKKANPPIYNPEV